MEEWKEIQGTRGVYVSTEGYIRYESGEYIKQRVGTAGYKIFTLSKNRRLDGKVGIYLTHRVVAEHFVDGRDLLRRYVDHTNGDKLDNRACNLRWATLSENMQSFWGPKPVLEPVECLQYSLGF